LSDTNSSINLVAAEYECILKYAIDAGDHTPTASAAIGVLEANLLSFL
jgi:hypothetical protein